MTEELTRQSIWRWRSSTVAGWRRGREIFERNARAARGIVAAPVSVLPRSVVNVGAACCLAVVVAGCAASRTSVPPPVKAPPRPQSSLPAPSVPSGIEPPAPAPEEEPAWKELTRADPVLGKATADLEAADLNARPLALMRRARLALDAADRLLATAGGPFGISSNLGVFSVFLASCELASHDASEVVSSFPQAPEAPEALFTVGKVNDHPYLNLFDEALETYRLTIERYPGTPWAVRADERIQLIHRMGGRMTGTPHGAPASPTAPGP